MYPLFCAFKGKPNGKPKPVLGVRFLKRHLYAGNYQQLLFFVCFQTLVWEKVESGRRQESMKAPYGGSLL